MSKSKQKSHLYQQPDNYKDVWRHYFKCDKGHTYYMDFETRFEQNHGHCKLPDCDAPSELNHSRLSLPEFKNIPFGNCVEPLEVPIDYTDFGNYKLID